MPLRRRLHQHSGARLWRCVMRRPCTRTSYEHERQRSWVQDLKIPFDGHASFQLEATVQPQRRCHRKADLLRLLIEIREDVLHNDYLRPVEGTDHSSLSDGLTAIPLGNLRPQWVEADAEAAQRGQDVRLEIHLGLRLPDSFDVAGPHDLDALLDRCLVLGVGMEAHSGGHEQTHLRTQLLGEAQAHPACQSLTTQALSPPQAGDADGATGAAGDEVEERQRPDVS
mmetsp:Transcript_125884/g.280847  ORF Transcript_125884/g.280847 Transcript_125884/m.280847 type:complete len:226 (-) Transcript_125884:146-823(-)